MRSLKLLLLFALAAVAAVPAWADTQTANINVGATIGGGCKILASTNLNFGTYDPVNAHFTTPLDATGSVTLRCLKDLYATVTLDQGNNFAVGSTCNAPLRQMYGDAGGDYLSYNVYQDSARTGVWGCAEINDKDFFGTGINNPITLTLYGRIPAAQDVFGDYYWDGLLLTVTF